MTTIFENGESFQVNDLFLKMRSIVRGLSEHKINRDPEAKLISRVKKEQRRQVQTQRHYIKANYSGDQFLHFVSGQVVTVVNRNIYGKLVIKWPDGNLNVIGDAEFEAAFSRKEA